MPRAPPMYWTEIWVEDMYFPTHVIVTAKFFELIYCIIFLQKFHTLLFVTPGMFFLTYHTKNAQLEEDLQDFTVL